MADVAVKLAGNAVRPVRVTVKLKFCVPVLPSVIETSLIDNVGAVSSLVMVPTPCASLMTAFVGAVRLTTKLSLFSKMASPLIVTLTVVVPLAPPPAIEPVPFAVT